MSRSPDDPPAEEVAGRHLRLARAAPPNSETEATRGDLYVTTCFKIADVLPMKLWSPP